MSSIDDPLTRFPPQHQRKETREREGSRR